MNYHQNHLHRLVLVSGIILGLLATGGYKASANAKNYNNNNTFNSNHMIITFSDNSLMQNPVANSKKNQKRPVFQKRPVQHKGSLLPRRTVIKYHRVLNGINHYYNHAKVAKPREIVSGRRYARKHLSSFKANAAKTKRAHSSAAHSVHDEHYHQSFYHPAASRNNHLIISFSTPSQQSYPVKAETERSRSANQTNSGKQSGVQLNNDASSVNDQVGDWFRDGLSDDELNARNWISWRESNDRWNVLSYNGDCIGYFQLSPRYLGYVNGHLNLDHQHQVKAADQYTKSKYGNWLAAKQFWLGHRWY